MQCLYFILEVNVGKPSTSRSTHSLKSFPMSMDFKEYPLSAGTSNRHPRHELLSLDSILTEIKAKPKNTNKLVVSLFLINNY